MEPMTILGSRVPGGDLVVREIGRGAVARVYLVSDGERVRALKLLPSGAEWRARHEHEIAHDLDHPHVNRVDAVVDVAGQPGVLMPFVPGRRLEVARRRSAGDPPGHERDACLDTIEDLLSGLAYLHERGVVHRDVKPENVLVDGRGRARLIDFDLAARVGSAGPASVAGTAAYVSPEQARGERAHPASDVYAAGILLYAAFTGEVPFTGSVAEVLEAHRVSPPRPPSSFDVALAPLDDLLARWLAKDPRERFESGAAALAALRAWRIGPHRREYAAAGRMAP
jgi:eukaryotic-like serine/threonine-protein kinase